MVTGNECEETFLSRSLIINCFCVVKKSKVHKEKASFHISVSSGLAESLARVVCIT